MKWLREEGLYVLCSVLMLVVFAACSYFPLRSDAECPLDRMLAREACIELGEHDLEAVMHGKAVAETFLALSDKNQGGFLVEDLVNILTKIIVVDDPRLSRCIQDLVQMFMFTGTVLSEDEMPRIRAVMQGFLDGALLIEEGGGTDG